MDATITLPSSSLDSYLADQWAASEMSAHISAMVEDLWMDPSQAPLVRSEIKAFLSLCEEIFGADEAQCRARVLGYNVGVAALEGGASMVRA